MLSTILLSLATVTSPAAAPPNLAPLVVQDDVEAKIAAAGEDIEKLLALAASLEEAEDKASARKVYEKVVELDPNHEEAHKALRHHFYDGQWFTSYASLSKYRREEKKRMAEKGLVRFQDEWVDEKIVPYLRMGWEKDESGTYVNPHKVREAARVADLTAKGYQQRAEDSVWVSPDEFGNWEGGLFKVGEDWVSADEAQEYHKEIGQWWMHQGEHFVAYSTCDLESNRWIIWWADSTYDDLVRLYGKEPDEKPVIGCLSSLAQYNNFAAGDQAAQRQPSEAGGFSSAHFAYHGDVWFDFASGDLQAGILPNYIGGGIAYYDANDEAQKAWGGYSVRHAAGLSYAEYIDRAWNTISEALTQQGGGGLDRIWEEKSIPRWMFYGGASYVERFRSDPHNPDNPLAIRQWAFGELAKQNFGPLEGFFGFPLDINDLEKSSNLITVSGAVVAFMLDGDCEPVKAKHAAFRKALMAGEDTEPALAELQAALIENEQKLRDFVGVGPWQEPAAEAGSVEAAATDGEG